jgi:hypothetical protein
LVAVLGQSPVMAAVWSVLIAIFPGPLSMFLLMIVPYWLGFTILALTVARRSPGYALILPLLALTPPAFLILGVIWRDAMMASSWLLAAALGFLATGSSNRARLPLQALAMILDVRSAASAERHLRRPRNHDLCDLAP